MQGKVVDESLLLSKLSASLVLLLLQICLERERQMKYKLNLNSSEVSSAPNFILSQLF